MQTIADIESDPHWQARGLTLDVPNGSGGVRMHNVVPRLSETPGEIRWPGGELGQECQACYVEPVPLGPGLAGLERILHAAPDTGAPVTALAVPGIREVDATVEPTPLDFQILLAAIGESHIQDDRAVLERLNDSKAQFQVLVVLLDLHSLRGERDHRGDSERQHDWPR